MSYIGAQQEERIRQLLCAAQEGDRCAYDEFLREIIPVITSTVSNRLGRMSKDDGDDITQDILLSIHSVLATYDPDRPVYPWLFAIIRHRIIDAARRSGRVRDQEIQSDAYPEEAFYAAIPATDEMYLDRGSLRSAIERLPAAQRQAIEVLRLKEMSLKEASVATNMSPAALKVAVHRGLKSLRKIMLG